MSRQATVSQEKLQRIIIEGDAQILVSEADKLGKRLADKKMTTSQIRAIFGTVRQIEMNWHEDADPDEYSRQLILLKPKLLYRVKKGNHKSKKALKTLATVINSSIDMVGTNRERFGHFVEFFEAILAYHKYHGGRDK